MSSKIYDLHSHTTASDGELAPATLVQAAKDAGVTVLAVTDHDTTAGIREAKAEGELVGVNVMAGVEISSRWSNQDIHIVGLNVDTEAPALVALLQQQEAFRVERAVGMGEKLSKLGFPEIYDLAVSNANGHVPGRPHFAKAMVDQGHCKDMDKVFSKFLGNGKKAFVKTEWVSVAGAVSVIKESGGVAVLAHPGKYKLTRMKLSRLVAAFSEAGGEGIEVSTGTQNKEQSQTAAALAKEFGLYCSTGSDYHGPTGRWVSLGKFPPLPSDCKPIWELFA
ncbi:hypothetical protein A9Q99_02870 [Gammaproteobacteria bacterium 45_16_T64]|nr:hypothetical protein A9Q99_02870 [Gammaproteobacteria bacterium 45_16_T64]